MHDSDRRFVRSTLVVLAVELVAHIACTTNTGFERLTDARRLSADLLVQFTKAADAGNRAVMAETDEMASAFVHEARQATAAVQKDTDQLAQVLESLAYGTESGLLDTFRGQFAEYQKLDGTILDLAVQNTNIKAQRLSFGPAQQAADSFRAALEALKPARPSDDWQVKALAATALTRVREIQVLQAPHIAEAADAPMTKMESQMAAGEGEARAALSTLEPLVAVESRSRLVEAGAALDRFIAVNKEIVALSRRNSDVRSLALSLNEKGKLTAACEATLRQLQDALAKRGVMGTR